MVNAHVDHFPAISEQLRRNGALAILATDLQLAYDLAQRSGIDLIILFASSDLESAMIFCESITCSPNRS